MEALNTLVKSCAYGSDQANTFLGDWKNHAVPIAFASGNFSASEKTAVLAAIESWNSFYGQVNGYAVFDGQGGKEAAISAPPTNICGSYSIIRNGTFQDSIILYKRGSGWSYGSGAIGVTTTCPDSHGTFYNAQMEINYQNYFGGGQMVPDLQSIVLHELGHLGGLDHSCASGGRNAKGAAVPDCGSASLPTDYYAAAMYPVMHFSGGQQIVHRTLEKNDQGRGNCLHW